MSRIKLLRFFVIISSIIFIIILLASNTTYANSYNFSVEQQTPEFYVNDFAGVFSNEQKQTMIDKAVELDSSYNGIQVVVTTLNSLEGHEIEEYAHAMYNQYGIGNDSMGILILLSVSDRDVRIETGYKMQAYFTDSISGRILDKYGMEYFKENKFSEGLVSVQNAVISKIQETVPTDWNMNTQKSNPIDGSTISIILFCFIILFVIGYGISKIVEKIRLKRKEKVEKIKRSRDAEWENKLESQKSRLSNINEELNSKIKQKDAEIYKLNNSNMVLENEVTQYEEKIERIKKIHPNIESEIAKQIEGENRKKALDWDNSVKSKVNLNVDENNVEQFSKVLKSYETLSNEEKKYVSTDINLIKEKYKKSFGLRDLAIATGVALIIEKVCKKYTNGDYKNYKEISEAYDKYDKLTTSQKNVFPNKKIISTFTNLYNSSKKDYKDYNVAEEVVSKIKDTLDSVGNNATRYDINKLKEAKSSYEDLTTSQKKYIEISMYELLLNLLKKAEDDEDAYERKRIASSSHTHSTSSSSISFGGHGGRSGGGGASRHF